MEFILKIQGLGVFLEKDLPRVELIYTTRFNVTPIDKYQSFLSQR